MLPGINIEFQNGNLASVVPSPDGVFGLLAHAEPVGGAAAVQTKWTYDIYAHTPGVITFNLPGVATFTIDTTAQTFANMAAVRTYIIAQWPTTGAAATWTVTAGTGNKMILSAPLAQAGLLEQANVSITGLSATIIFTAGSAATTGPFNLDTVYTVKGMNDVFNLGIVDSVDNHRLYKWLKEFYAEAGEGAELWLLPFSREIPMSAAFTPDGAGLNRANKLAEAANGRLRAIFTVMSPDYTVTVENGLSNEVMTTKMVAQTFAENYTNIKRAPFFVILEGYAFNGSHIDLVDLTQDDKNRVGIVIGDTESRTGTTASFGANTATLAGRLSKIQVHVNAGKVSDGSLNVEKIFIKDTPVELYDIDSLYSKGYITYRTHQGKSGYYMVDDQLSTAVSDDYRHITHRRVVDKAYRIAYTTLLDFLLADIPVTNSGTIMPAYAKTLEGKVMGAIAAQMTANGELSADPSNPNDLGVICKVSLTANVTSSSQITIDQLAVRPKAHARWFDVPLGFVPVNS